MSINVATKFKPGLKTALPQGSLKFLYENYSIERIVLDREDEVEDEAEVEREETVTEW